MKIVLCYPVERKHLEWIAAAAPDDEIINAGQKGVAQALFEADIFCGHAKVPVDWDGVVRRGRLQWIQSSAAGMDHCLVPSVIDSNITVTSASGVLADQVAEHAIALITGWLRSLPAFLGAQQRREFDRLPTRDLHHTTVGIVGFGGVGRRLAKLLSGFKTRLLATDLFPADKPDYVESLWSADRLPDLLAASDIVVLCLPLNAATRNVIDAAAIDRMKPHALLANMARGQLVVTDALTAALRSGRIAGAVMDVTEPEPLPPDNPLWECSNVIITPHVGGQSALRIDDMTRMFCANLRRRRAGKPLINLIEDKRLGFPIRKPGMPLWVDVCEKY